MSDPDRFLLCSICKKPIGFETEFFACSVSTCNRKRMALSFCSLGCFEAHVPGARHRDAWAEPRTAPSRAEWQKQRQAEASKAGASADDRAPAHAEAAPRRVVAAGGASNPTVATKEPSREVLVVVSKLKKYVREVSGMSTSDGVAAVLSDHLREICREALRHAARDDRRTVLDRDVLRALRDR